MFSCIGIGITDKFLVEQGIPFPEVYRKFNKWCSKRYSSRREILADEALLEFYCPWCVKAVKCEPWLAAGGAPMAYGVCPDGDEFLVQLSIVYHRRDEYSVKRMIFEMSDDLWDIYMDKKEAALGAAN